MVMSVQTDRNKMSIHKKFISIYEGVDKLDEECLAAAADFVKHVVLVVQAL